jgi:hypothetical protein
MNLHMPLPEVASLPYLLLLCIIPFRIQDYEYALYDSDTALTPRE